MPTNQQFSLERESMQLNRDISMADIATREDAAYMQEKEERDDLTRWQQDLDDDLQLLKYNLRDWQKTENGWEKVEYSKPLMNEKGISRIITLVRRYLTRNYMMSNLEERVILRIMRGLVVTVVLNIGENYDNYEIDESDLRIIIKMVKDTVEPTLYRALHNGERKYLTTTNKRIETYSRQPEAPQKKGLFGTGG